MVVFAEDWFYQSLPAFPELEASVAGEQSYKVKEKGEKWNI